MLPRPRALRVAAHFAWCGNPAMVWGCAVRGAGGRATARAARLRGKFRCGRRCVGRESGAGQLAHCRLRRCGRHRCCRRGRRRCCCRRGRAVRQCHCVAAHPRCRCYLRSLSAQLERAAVAAVAGAFGRCCVRHGRCCQGRMPTTPCSTSACCNCAWPASAQSRRCRHRRKQRPTGRRC